MHYILCILVLVAGISPLLTFTRLWQVKEWRYDRLREHLRHEGWFRQLFGLVKPIVVAIGIVFYLIHLPFADDFLFDPAYILWATSALLAWFTMFRLVVGKQARPVWTNKALAVAVISFTLFGIVDLILCGYGWAVIILTLLPLFMFVFAGLALALLQPLDRLLKKRLITKAMRIRSKCPNLTVVGITGSVGKTTTKELLAHILSDRNILVTPAHVNTEMGVAGLMTRKLKEEKQIFIVEMGAYTRGEIGLLCSLVKPQIGVITFIGKQHLGLFGSMEDLCSAKGELFSALPPEGHAFLNADPEHCKELMKLADCPVHTVGTGGHATYEAFDIQESGNGVSFTVRGEQFTVPIPGTHQVTNVLLAVAVAETLGVPVAESAKRLLTMKPLPQTFEKKEGAKGQVVLDDTHNASPASFRAAIEWARNYTKEKKVLVTSGLLELGKEECAIHRELGMNARGVFDEVVFLSKKCVRSFEQGYGKTVKVFPKKKFKMALSENMLIVCEGRMPNSIVEKLLS